MIRSVRAFAVACAMVAMLVVTPSAVAAWSAPEDLTAQFDGLGEYSDGDVAVAADGTAHAILRTHDGANWVIVARHRPPGGDWSAPTTLSAAGDDAQKPRIAVAPDGTAHAIWLRGAPLVVQASRRPAGGAWEPATDLSDGLTSTDWPSIAVATDGTVHATWSLGVGIDYALVHNLRAPGDAWDQLDQTTVFSTVDYYYEASAIAVAADGTLYVVAREYDTIGDVNELVVRERSAAGAWSAPVSATSSFDAAGDRTMLVPAIAVDSDGLPSIAYAYRDPTGDNLYRVETRARVDATTWSISGTPQGTGMDDIDAPRLFAGGDGSLLAAWIDFDGVDWTLRSSTKPSDLDPWDGPQAHDTVTQPAPASDIAPPTFDAHVGTDGAAALVWTDDATGGDIRIAAFDGSAWAAPSDVIGSTTSLNPRLAVGPDGTLHVASWLDSTGDRTPRATLLDTADPALSSISVPAAGTVGTAVAMSATATDVGIGLAAGQPVWDFGDGSADATGTAPSHAYSAAGSYTVTISALDEAGNDVSTTRSILISAVPVPATTPPSATTRARVTGILRSGNRVRCRHDAFTGTDPITYSYQWFVRGRDGFEAVPGATGEQFRLTISRRNAFIRCAVTATNAGGSTTSTSTARLVQAPPSVVRRPHVGGTFRAGEFATCHPGRWRATHPNTFRYRWQRKVASGAWRAIPGQRKRRYLSTPADGGTLIRCMVTASNPAGTSAAVSAARRLR